MNGVQKSPAQTGLKDEQESARTTNSIRKCLYINKQLEPDFSEIIRDLMQALAMCKQKAGGVYGK